MRRPLRPRNVAGVSLVELMVAMVLGLLVAAGIVSVFLSTSANSRAQNQLAQVQEEGRYAVGRIVDDLRMANAQYCTSTGGVASQAGSGLYLDGLRAPVVFARNLLGALSTSDLTTRWGSVSGTNTYPATPVAPYSLPSFLWMRGYDCDSTTCAPVNPPTSVVPAMGKSPDHRVVGTSVLTLRYVDGARGWAIGGGSYVVSEPSGTIVSIHLAPSSSEPPITAFKAGDLAMLSDCSGGQVFAVSGGPDLTPEPTLNFTAPVVRPSQAGPRLFHFNTDFLTVTYFLKVVANDDGSTTGALMRKDSSGSQEMVRGVERLDFLYGIEDSHGHTRYLTANEVDSNAGGTLACPSAAPLPLERDPGCLWRAVKSIEVRLLVAADRPLYTLTAQEQMYSYQLDGIAKPAAPDAPGRRITPAEQGFANPKVRREFIALVSVRNFNP
jgi:type IV pilus assembly protein PilW